MTMKRRLLLAVALLAKAHAALATDPGLEHCRTIAADALRLACYDRLSARLPGASPGVLPSLARITPGTLTSLKGDEPFENSPMQQSWDMGPGTGEDFAIRPYRSVYLLPAFTASSTNAAPNSSSRGAADTAGIKATEAKFQLSFKTRLAANLLGDNGDLWAAYTQSSRWQVYSSPISRPFRETNYEPELIFVWKTQAELAGFKMRYASLGLNHQSNGRANPLSRSWNRVIGQVGLEKDDVAITLRSWRRIPEKAGSDDNPDIEKYLGRGEVELAKRFGQHLLVARMHRPLLPRSESKSSLRLDYAFPLSGRLRGHVQYFTGHGESLIDYNHKANYLGVGISLVEPY